MKKRKTQVYKDLAEQYFRLMSNENKRRKATNESAADRIRKVSVLSSRREFLFNGGLYPHTPPSRFAPEQRDRALGTDRERVTDAQFMRTRHARW